MLQVAGGLGLGLVLGYSFGRMQAKRDLREADRENLRKRPLSRPTSSSDVAAEHSMPNAKEIAAAKAARARLGYQGGAVSATVPQDGKLPDGPEPAAQDTEYLDSNELQPLSSPATAAETALCDLGSSEWMVKIRGLNTLRQLAVHHKADAASSLSSSLPLVTDGVKSLRSSVCKTAILCSTDYFRSLRDGILPYVDIGGSQQPQSSLLLQLLLKASSNDKRFVVEEAQRALHVLTESLDPVQLLNRLMPYTAHRNPKVRGQVAKVIRLAAAQLSSNNLASFGVDRLLKTTGTFISDNTPEARDAARQMVPLLHRAHASETSVPSSDSMGKENQGFPAANTRSRSKLQTAEPNAQENASAGPLQSMANGSSEAGRPNWEEFCHSTLSTSAAAAVLRVSNQ
ncbi:hypothetical protein WJX74_009933 [Apatococcus lobatus]|uniref:TOG domain-containing protein n=1 Tax=Apatococcus lobatus TaxID=904363 RepID=A0AAW1R3C4_9CHLO